jgi:hypothetical protein
MQPELMAIILLWVALQFPLGSFLGECIRLGSGRYPFLE